MQVMKRVISLVILFSLLLSQATFAYTSEQVGKVLLIGDSYCTGSNINDDGIDKSEDAWAEYAAREASLKNYEVLCENGFGFVGSAPGVEDKVFVNLINNYAETHDDLEQVNWLVLAAGYNDIRGSYEQIMEAGNAFIARANEIFPNAKILLAMVGWHATDEGIQSKLKNIVLKAYQDLAKNDIVYEMDNISLALNGYENGGFSNDNLHPSAFGQEYIAFGVANYLEYIFEVTYDGYENSNIPNEPSKIQILVPLALILGTSLVIAVILRIRISRINK